MTHRFAAWSFRTVILFLVLGACLSWRAGAATPDLPGWETARWGMTASEIEQAWPRPLTRLADPLDYRGAYAELASLGERVAGLDFTAFFQMNSDTRRLQQVLLERRRPLARPVDFQNLLDGLSDRFGQPDERCIEADPDGAVLRIEFIWRFASTTLHASFLDFSSTGVLTRDPALPLDEIGDLLDERLLNERTVPRRILLRAHAADRTDLAPECGGTAG